MLTQVLSAFGGETSHSNIPNDSVYTFVGRAYRGAQLMLPASFAIEFHEVDLPVS